jgi:S1-C subfamily serine protease
MRTHEAQVAGVGLRISLLVAAGMILAFGTRHGTFTQLEHDGRLRSVVTAVDAGPWLSRELGFADVRTSPWPPGGVIAQIRDGSAAARAGLRPRDLILEIDGQPLASAAQLDATLAVAPDAHHTLVMVERQGTRIVVVLSR